MNKKPSCNLCGASLVEEDCALICGDCARPREEWLKDQAEQLAIAHQMGYAEGDAALRVMAQDHKRPTDGLPVVTHNVACCISPEEVAEGEREAYNQGAKDFAKEVRERAVGPLDVIINDDLARAFYRTRLRLELGEWPPKETPCQTQ